MSHAMADIFWAMTSSRMDAWTLPRVMTTNRTPGLRIVAEQEEGTEMLRDIGFGAFLLAQ